ncbi:MAG: hypothetical protein GY864_13720 [Desulfobacterales bacterium]|nr:hypothetical protein [Desulfobacterales bacterium]
MVSTFKEQEKLDLDNVFYNTKERAIEIDWDDDRIVVLEDQVESEGNEFETGLEKKLITVRKSSINVGPAIDDEIRLNFDLEKVDFGDYWRVEKVTNLEYEWQIVFVRNVS